MELLSNAQSLIEYLQKRALRFFLNDYDSTYEDLLEKSGYPNMNLRRQKTLCIEWYMTFLNLEKRTDYFEKNVS